MNHSALNSFNPLSSANVAAYVTIGVLVGVVVVLVIVIVVLFVLYKNRAKKISGWWRFCLSRRGSPRFYDRLPSDGQGPTEAAQQVT